MSAVRVETSEIAIFSRVLEPEQGTLSVAAARSILALGFHQVDRERMGELSARAQEGSLSPGEQAEINNYERVGHLLSLMKSKARLSLKRRGERARGANPGLGEHPWKPSSNVSFGGGREGDEAIR